MSQMSQNINMTTCVRCLRNLPTKRQNSIDGARDVTLVRHSYYHIMKSLPTDSPGNAHVKTIIINVKCKES
jgi:hypothetical protein